MSRRHKGKTFAAWLAANGAVVLSPCDYEMARFCAQDTLCIAYERNRKGKQSFVPALAGQAFAAWQTGKTLDLRNTPPSEVYVPSHRETADIVCGLITRIRAGETLDIEAAAETSGFAPERIANIGAAWGFRVGDGKIVRVSA